MIKIQAHSLFNTIYTHSDITHKIHKVMVYIFRTTADIQLVTLLITTIYKH